LRREEAISVLKELLDNCTGLDGHYFELAPPNEPTSTKEGYQIIIKAALDQEKKMHTIHTDETSTNLSNWKHVENKAVNKQNRTRHIHSLQTYTQAKFKLKP